MGLRLWIKLMLFISAYSPLILIFIIKNIEGDIIVFWLSIMALIVINLVWLVLFKYSKKWTKHIFNVNKSINRTSDALDYIIAYILAFITFNFDQWQDIASLIILLFIIFFVYIRSNLIFINPLLSILGYTIHDVDVVEGGSIILISKKTKIKADSKISVRNMSDDIYLEA